MRAPELMHGTRFVAAPSALDALAWPDDGTPLRSAPDDLLILHSGSYRVALGDEPIIQEEEAGFVGWWLTPEELDHVVTRVDWPLPTDRPALAQGLIAGVPAKLWLAEDRALLLCAAAYAHELMERLP